MTRIRKNLLDSVASQKLEERDFLAAAPSDSVLSTESADSPDGIGDEGLGVLNVTTSLDVATSGNETDELEETETEVPAISTFSTIGDDDDADSSIGLTGSSFGEDESDDDSIFDLSLFDGENEEEEGDGAILEIPVVIGGNEFRQWRDEDDTSLTTGLFDVPGGDEGDLLDDFASGSPASFFGLNDNDGSNIVLWVDTNDFNYVDGLGPEDMVVVEELYGARSGAGFDFSHFKDAVEDGVIDYETRGGQMFVSEIDLAEVDPVFTLRAVYSDNGHRYDALNQHSGIASTGAYFTGIQLGGRNRADISIEDLVSGLASVANNPGFDNDGVKTVLADHFGFEGGDFDGMMLEGATIEEDVFTDGPLSIAASQPDNQILDFSVDEQSNSLAGSALGATLEAPTGFLDAVSGTSKTLWPWL